MSQTYGKRTSPGKFFTLGQNKLVGAPASLPAPVVTGHAASRRELVVTYEDSFRLIVRPALTLTRKIRGLGSLEIYQGDELLVSFRGPTGSEPDGRLMLMAYGWNQRRLVQFWREALRAIPRDGSPADVMIWLGIADYRRLEHDNAKWDHLPD